METNNKISKFDEDPNYCNPNQIKILDISEMRDSLPEQQEFKMDWQKLLTLVQRLIGKDLSKFRLPIFINEPLTILQKTSELFAFSEILTDASKEKDPLLRMVKMCTFIAGSQSLILGRTSKPFISLLGETFELVTNKFKFYGETVSQQPPILVFNVTGDGFEVNKTVTARMHFNGTQVRVVDTNQGDFTLFIRENDQQVEENYLVELPSLVIGQILLPSKYIEPNGKMKIVNQRLGITCEIDFLSRAWTSNYYTNRVEAKIFDHNQIQQYKVEGYYNGEIYAQNLQTLEKFLVFRSPLIQQTMNNEYGLNILALRLNQISEELKKKLPPTDCRLRDDLRLWESKQGEQAEIENERIENNQIERRKKVLEMKQEEIEDEFQDCVDDEYKSNSSKNSEKEKESLQEEEFYCPRFFIRNVNIDSENGKKIFTYAPIKNKYWELREKGTWDNVPRIYDDECQPFM